MTLQDAAKLCGSRFVKNTDTGLPIRTAVSSNLPTSYDARVVYPNCPSVHTILDQGRCGSCWCFGAIESISDRFCIASKANFTATLSAQALTTCDNSDDGCEGGEPSSAMEYIHSAGIPTWGCQPYTIPTCPPALQPCRPNTFVNTPSCNMTCLANYTTTWKKDLHFVQPPYSISSEQTAIMTEIMTKGPVEATFLVYADFLTYKTGVYQHKTGGLLGGHAVKMIGWGVDNSTNTPYWLIANSWTSSWGGLNGYFWMLRGQNECGIEQGIVASEPDLSRSGSLNKK